MQPQLKSLKIDRSRKRRDNGRTKWIVAAIAIVLLLGAGRIVYGMLNAPVEVEVMRVSPPSMAAAAGAGSSSK